MVWKEDIFRRSHTLMRSGFGDYSADKGSKEKESIKENERSQ